MAASAIVRNRSRENWQKTTLLDEFNRINVIKGRPRAGA
jgi:hypothetical protein